MDSPRESQFKELKEREQKHWDEESERLDNLRIDHAKLTAKVEFIEDELREHKGVVREAISELNDKIMSLDRKVDNFLEKFMETRSEIKLLAAKVAFGAVVVGLIAQVIMNHLEII